MTRLGLTPLSVPGLTSTGPMSLAAAMGLDIGSGAPAVTTNKLYQIDGALYFNGSAVGGAGGGFSSTDDTTTNTGIYYPVVATAAGGSIAKTLSTALAFDLSTDTLSVPGLSAFSISTSTLSVTNNAIANAFRSTTTNSANFIGNWSGTNYWGFGGGAGHSVRFGMTDSAGAFQTAPTDATFQFDGKLNLFASSTTQSTFNVPDGTAPATPIKGDIWAASGALYYYDGSVAKNLTAAGGSGSPGGANTQVQFNNNGSFGGSADFTYDSATAMLSLLGTNTTFLMKGITTEPAAPASGTLKLYTKNIGGRMLPKWVGPSGVDTPIQPFVGMNHVRGVVTGTGTTAALVCDTYGGTAFTASASTYAQTTPATGSLKSRTRLSSLTSAATAGAIAYIKGNVLECARETGFFMVMRFGLDTLATGNLGFFGLHSSVTALTATTNQVTSTTAHVGLAIQANTGNWQLVSASGSAVTATDLGASFPVNTTDLMELILFSAPGGSVISYRVTNMTTGATVSGDLSTNLPSNTTYMTFHEALSNNATAAAVKFSHKSYYLETDF